MSVADPFVVRRATAADLEALGRLGAGLMRLHYQFDRQRFLAPGDDAEEGYAQFLVSQLSRSDVGIFVAEAAPGHVVGYVYAAVEPLSWKELRDRAGYIHDIFLDETARGSGAGSRLIDAAVNWLKEQGVPRVLLWTAAPNTRARTLFEAHGFRPTMVEMTREI